MEERRDVGKSVDRCNVLALSNESVEQKNTFREKVFRTAKKGVMNFRLPKT